ncbi:MAG: hypothetical protein HQL46_16820 [Gammaproteobacteria bacterium]|nr:hypothetical protein [Gammaproteobacteria bacterium]
MANSKTFRLLLSSMYNNMRPEHDRLQAEVFPKLRAYCEQNSFSSQAIDFGSEL